MVRTGLLLHLLWTAASALTLVERMVPRKSFLKLRKSNGDLSHEVVIAIRQRNIDVLERMVLERSTPGGDLYQRWMTFDEVDDLIKNDEAHDATVDWLRSNGISVTWSSRRKEYIRASSSISNWERMLSTRFFEWADTSSAEGSSRTASATGGSSSSSSSSSTVHRSEHYSLPDDLVPHITAVLNVCEVSSHSFVLCVSEG